MSSLVLADPTYALALVINMYYFSTKQLVDSPETYHDPGRMPSECEEDHMWSVQSVARLNPALVWRTTTDSRKLPRAYDDH